MTCPKSKDGKHEFEEFAVWCDGQHGIRCVHCSENEYEDGSGDDSPLFTIADIEAQAREDATLKLLDELEKWNEDIYHKLETHEAWGVGGDIVCDNVEKHLQNWIADQRKKINGGTD